MRIRSIPRELSALSQLAVINVSSNRLCGQIPTETQFSTFNASVFERNWCLCGTPLPSCRKKAAVPPESPSADDEGWWRRADEQVSLIAVGLGVGIGYGGVIWVLVWWREHKRAYVLESSSVMHKDSGPLDPSSTNDDDGGRGGGGRRSKVEEQASLWRLGWEGVLVPSVASCWPHRPGVGYRRVGCMLVGGYDVVIWYIDIHGRYIEVCAFMESQVFAMPRAFCGVEPHCCSSSPSFMYIEHSMSYLFSVVFPLLCAFMDCQVFALLRTFCGVEPHCCEKCLSWSGATTVPVVSFLEYLQSIGASSLDKHQHH
eukprot:Gb_11562 [translate_table: standard]